MSAQTTKTEEQKQDEVVTRIKQVYSRTGEKTEDERLLQAYTYITQIPSKNMRARMQAAFNYWLNVPEDKIDIAEDIITIVHNTTLLLDDIKDNAIVRKGVPSAHSVFGSPCTISSVNYGISIALEKVLQLDQPDATMMFIEQMMDLQRGRGLDMYYRNNFICPTEEEYSLMIMKKAGGLSMMAIRFLQMFSSFKEDFSQFANTLSLSVQIIDDYKDIISKDKTYITEGKFTFPIIHAVHTHPEDKEILEILQLKTSDDKLKRRCGTLLKKYGSIEYTKEKIMDLWDEALDENEKLGSNPYMEVIIGKVFEGF